MKHKNNSSVRVPKIIIYTAKIAQFFSINLATKYAIRLFITPIKHPIPKRELAMDLNSQQSVLYIPTIDKSIQVYQYGNSIKKVLLIHGWSGRGTQLVKIADELLAYGYSTVSFDAPAHGKSEGKTTIMTEFIASILGLEKTHGPFEFAIGHSLGAMSLLNAVKQGLLVQKIIIIGSGDKIQDILDHFVKQLQLKPIVAQKMKTNFEAIFGELMENYAAHVAAQNINIPALIIHDKDDYEVPVYCSKNIKKHLKNSELLITEKLGHRKILGDKQVIAKIIDFIKT